MPKVATLKTQKDIESFEDIHSKVQAAYHEADLLASKNPDGAMNKFKLSLTNGLIVKTNSYLGGALPIDGFQVFDDENIPSNSDVRFVLGQYQSALEQIRVNNIYFDINLKGWYWSAVHRATYAPVASVKKSRA